MPRLPPMSVSHVSRAAIAFPPQVAGIVKLVGITIVRRRSKPGRYQQLVSQVALDYREKVVGLYRSLGFETDELAVLAALTVGDKEELSDDIVETYSVSGASHVLALSGLHIGFLYALLLFVLRPLWRRWQRLKPLLLLLQVLFLVSFAFFTGLSSSVVRSVVMFSLLYKRQRRKHQQKDSRIQNERHHGNYPKISQQKMSGKTGEIENDQRGRTQLSRHGHCHKSPQISQETIVNLPKGI